MNSTGSQPQSQSQSQGSHSLAFRVMRLCKPSFHVDPPLRLDLSDLIAGEDIFDDPIAASNLTPLLDRHVANPTDSSDLSYRARFLLHDSSDPMGLSSLLVLPQSFGWVSLSLSLSLSLSILVFDFWLKKFNLNRAIYLGETFCSYISINNSSNFEVKDVIIKVSSSHFIRLFIYNNYKMNCKLLSSGVSILVSLQLKKSCSVITRCCWFQAEIQTERQRLLLLDTSKSPVESIRAGGRYDFIVEHDVKELGPHT